MNDSHFALAPGALVTVIGGSGFIGRYIVQRLAEAGYRVRVVVRHPDPALFLKPLGGLGQIQIVRGDIGSDAGIARVFDGAAGGINLVGILDEKGGQRFVAVQAEGAGRAARAAAAAGITAYVQMSAIGADPASAVPYARTKAEGEAAVRAAIPTAVVLRPSLVVGPEDQFLNRFAAMAKVAPVLPVIAGDSKFQPVYVQDVAAAAVAALTRADAAGQIFELGGPEALSFRAILTMINAETRHNRTLVEVPASLAGLMARMGDTLPFMPITSDQLAMLKKDNVANPALPGLAALGITPTPMAAFVPAMLERYRPGGRFNKAD
ncbi:complex I NDUFA9 subunit family protein [Polymorphobacter fuscus]|uniref:NAD-dependent epimerase/dehydratase family protein n=1 Tax=Sandarakinorhabdus fusca TaxID=1439888 RepID=A0A7C9GPS9_9SPHN|nr:complex I NDUFA9 subunit family protein [Polymorphobacter fuscus]KAB7646493.1 complex I NDUFA9 subunit family protein [Polymorphobacter fuscus]MQT17737.1 NAD-dependent epimerase/dehydratase family protein [Polymorphobacter fuscus]NJC09715.1 NADH dehydrogenase [Polymorphobacter fuscus]